MLACSKLSLSLYRSTDIDLAIFGAQFRSVWLRTFVETSEDLASCLRPTIRAQNQNMLDIRMVSFGSFIANQLVTERSQASEIERQRKETQRRLQTMRKPCNKTQFALARSIAPTTRAPIQMISRRVCLDQRSLSA